MRHRPTAGGVWPARSRARVSLLGVGATVVASTAALAVLVVALAPAVASARASAVSDRATARGAVAVAVALDGLAAVLLGVVATVTLVVVLDRVRLARAAEDALLVARGATRSQLGWRGAAEGAVVGVVGSTVGVLVGIVVLLVVDAGAARPGATALAGLLVVTFATTGSAAVAGVVSVRGRGGRTGVAGQVVAAGVLLAAAAFATWRTFASGVPVRVDRSGAVVDLVAAAAPVVWMLAGAAVVLLLAGLLARTVARGAARRHGLLLTLAARRTARTWRATAPVVVVVAVVAGTGVFVAGFAATVAVVDAAAVTAEVGPDVRVRIDGDGQVEARTALPAIALPAGREAVVTPVWTDTATLGDVEAAVVAVPGPRSAAVLGRVTAAAVAADDDRGDTAVGVRLPSGDRTVTVDVRADPATLAGVVAPDALGTVSLGAWVVDGAGVPALVALRAEGSAEDDGAVPLGTTATLRGTLPDAGSDWRLLAVQPALSFATRPDAVDAGTTTDHLEVTVTASVRGVDGVVTGQATAVDLAAPTRTVLGARPGSTRIPVVLTTTLADRLGLRVGSPLDVTPASTGSTLRAVVRAVVPGVAGAASSSAIAVDLDRVVAASVDGGATDPGGPVPRVDERWIATSDPAAVAATAGRGLPSGSMVTTASSARSAPVVDSAVGALTGVALLGTLFVALVAVTTVVDRDPSRRVLRAAGVRAGRSALARAGALAAVMVTAVLGGTLTGLVAVAVCVAPFALAAVPSALGLVRADPVVTGAGVWAVPGLLLVVTAAVSGWLLVRDRRREGAA